MRTTTPLLPEAPLHFPEGIFPCHDPLISKSCLLPLFSTVFSGGSIPIFISLYDVLFPGEVPTLLASKSISLHFEGSTHFPFYLFFGLFPFPVSPFDRHTFNPPVVVGALFLSVQVTLQGPPQNLSERIPPSPKVRLILCWGSKQLGPFLSVLSLFLSIACNCDECYSAHVEMYNRVPSQDPRP